MILKGVRRVLGRDSAHPFISVNPFNLGHPRLSSPFGKLRKIVCDRVPRRAAIDKGMELWPNAGVVVESSHANRHLRTVWPIAAEEAGTAVYTKRFHGTF